MFEHVDIVFFDWDRITVQLIVSMLGKQEQHERERNVVELLAEIEEEKIVENDLLYFDSFDVDYCCESFDFQISYVEHEAVVECCLDRCDFLWLLSAEEDLGDDSIDEICWATALEYENFYYDEEQAEERIVLEESDEKIDRLDFENEMVLEAAEEYAVDVDQALEERRNANESSDIHLDWLSESKMNEWMNNIKENTQEKFGFGVCGGWKSWFGW